MPEESGEGLRYAACFALTMVAVYLGLLIGLWCVCVGLRP